MIEPANIIELATTKDEANQLQSELTHLLDAMFSNKPFEELINEYISYEKKNILFSLMHKQQIDIKNTAQIQHFLQEIKEILHTIPIVELTLAFSPKQQLISTLSGWCITHLKKPVLLDISVNKRLLGGVIVTYKGIYKDFSLKRQLEEKYKNGMDTLLSSQLSS